ncbi:hypothetical protein PG984_001467 [Apiospora sp. TS-2023a]
MLPHHLQQAISANQARLIQWLRDENSRLKAGNTSSPDGSLRALVEERFRRYTERICQLEKQLAERNARIEQNVADVGEHCDHDTKLRLQVQVKDDLNRKQATQIYQQAKELEELRRKNQHKALQIQRLEDTIRHGDDRIGQSDSRSRYVIDGTAP